MEEGQDQRVWRGRPVSQGRQLSETLLQEPLLRAFPPSVTSHLPAAVVEQVF